MDSKHISSALLCGALALSGCSLIKLSDDITQAQCDEDRDCEVLNDRNASDFDECEIWQCDPTSNYCVFGPLDADGDGARPAMCESDPAKVDCADDDDKRYGGLPEDCDNIDNDCDDHVDEGVLTAGSAQRWPSEAERVSFSVDPDDGQIAIGYGIGAQTQPGLSTVALANGDLKGGVQALGGGGVALLDVTHEHEGVGLTAFEEDFVVAFLNASGGRNPVAALVKPVTGGFQFATGTDPTQLLCFKDPDPDAPKCPVESAISTPSLTVIDEDAVLVTYAELGETSVDACGVDVQMPVTAHTLRRVGDTLVKNDYTAAMLGETSDPRSPALLTNLGDADSPNTSSALAAFANAEHDIEIWELREEAGKVIASTEPLLVIESEQALSQVSMTVGPKDDAQTVVGLTVRSGCGAASSVLAYLLRITASGGALQVVMHAGPTEVGSGKGARNPSIAYSAERKSWAIAYGDNDGLRLRVLDVDGGPRGQETYLALGSTLLSAPAVVKLADEQWFGAIAQTTSSAGPALEAVSFACE